MVETIYECEGCKKKDYNYKLITKHEEECLIKRDINSK